MRKEATIQKRLDKLMASKYRIHNTAEIAALRWVLGEAISTKNAVHQEIVSACPHERQSRLIDGTYICQICGKRFTEDELP